MNNFMNNDFDPEILRDAIRRANAASNFIKGRWRNVQAWVDAGHRKAFLSGEAGVKPLWSCAFPNGITDVGIHYALDVGFVSGSQITAWYAGLIDNASFSGVDPSDTMGSHGGWIENQDYDESVRQTLGFSAAANRTISDTVSFTMNDNVTIRGLFVTSDNVKGGVAGTLFSTALFGTPPALVVGNVLTANYSLSD